MQNQIEAGSLFRLFKRWFCLISLTTLLLACDSSDSNSSDFSNADSGSSNSGSSNSGSTNSKSSNIDSIADKKGLPSQPTADLILTNGRVYTFNWDEPNTDGKPANNAPHKNGKWQPDANAIAIKAGKILFVGNKKEVHSFKSEQTKIIELNGATIIPGLIDSHVHIAELGEILSRINLIGLQSPDNVIEHLKTSLSKKPVNAGEWIIGQGWDEGAWANQYPDRQLLDSHFPNNPVYLKSLHGFGVWVNTAALKAAGIDSKTQPPVGGEILKDINGAPTGILLNRATTLMQNAIPKPTDDVFEQWIVKGLEKMASDGFVSIHQAGAESKHIKAFQSLQKKNQLPIRVYAMLSARDQELSTSWIEKGPLVDPKGWLDIRSVKAYYDGALGSRGARLLEDYSDKPGHRGVAGDGYGFDQALVKKLMASGFQVGIHAIGDAGNREVLDFIENVSNEMPTQKALRHRIEHAQVIANLDIPRLAEMGIVASMEPAHAVEDKTWAQDRLGADRIQNAYAWRKLRQADTKLALNSDLPGSDHSIFYGLHSAVTRQDKNSQPENGWTPSQKLSIEEAVRGFTHWSAYAGFREKETGKIEVNRWADLTIVDIDVMAIGEKEPKKLFDGNVLMTIVDGKVVYQAQELAVEVN